MRLGFIPEFRDREDGWPGLKKHYDLPQTDVREMNHTLAYRALVEKAIDVTEVYTTDGEIAQYDLLVLADDRNFFPAYEAVWLYRADLENRDSKVVKQLLQLEGRITESDMQKMNAVVQEQKADEGRVANEFLRLKLGVGHSAITGAEGTLAERVLKTTGEHLLLVVPSLLAAILVAVPLGVIAVRRQRLGKVHPCRDWYSSDHSLTGVVAVHDPGDDVARWLRDWCSSGNRCALPL